MKDRIPYEQDRKEAVLVLHYFLKVTDGLLVSLKAISFPPTYQLEKHL